MFDEEGVYEVWEDEFGDEYITLPLEQFRNIVRMAYGTGKQHGIERSIEIIKENDEKYQGKD